MRKIICLVSALTLLLIGSFQAQASEQITADIYFNRAGIKMLSGIANMATGWMELPKNIILWNQKDNSALVGVPEGMLWGIVHTASRTASGAFDVATFWLPTFPTPSPLFIWDDFSQDSDYYGFRMGR